MCVPCLQLLPPLKEVKQRPDEGESLKSRCVCVCVCVGGGGGEWCVGVCVYVCTD